MSGTAPARWRLVREDDHLRRWQCDGDGVDLCRAPATWVAEHEANDGVVHVVGQRCPDHIPVRAFAGSTLPAPPSRSLQPAAETHLPETLETPVAPVVPSTVETEPQLADTQQADKFKSPPPPSSSMPADVTEIEDDEKE